MSYISKLVLVGKALTEPGRTATFTPHKEETDAGGFNIEIADMRVHLDSTDTHALKEFLAKNDIQ